MIDPDLSHAGWHVLEDTDTPPAGWQVIRVMRARGCGWDWVALMADISEDIRSGAWRRRPVHERLVRIAGKHKSRTAAAHALENMMATRH